MRMCFFGSAIVLLSILGVPLSADSLAGRVLDPQGKVIANADLSLFNRTSGNLQKAISSANGEYSFQDIAPGAYLVEAQTGETALSLSQEITVSGVTTKDLTLSLAQSTVRVTVTANNTPISEQEVAKVVDVVDSQDINLRDEFSVTDAVRNLPGVRVRQLGGPGSYVSVATRGMRDVDTAVLIDGLRFRDAGSPAGDATAFLEDMDIVDTSRIEFLQGAGSTLYGTNAMAGVINISSDQGGGKPHGSIRAEGGGLGMMRGTANIAGGAFKDRLDYSGGYSYLNLLDNAPSNSPYRNNGEQGYFKLKLTDKMSLSGRVWNTRTFLSGIASPTFTAATLANFPAAGPVPGIGLAESQLSLYGKGLPYTVGNATFIPSVSELGNDRYSTSLTGAVIFSHELTPNTSYRVSYQGVDTKRDYSGLNFPGSNSHYDGRTDTLQARLDTRIGKTQLINLGYEYEREEYYNLESGAQRAPGDGLIDAQQYNHAVYGQDQLRLFGGRLQVALAGRVQTFGLNGLTIAGQGNPYAGATYSNPDNSYTGDISVSYFVASSQTKFRGHIGNSYRAPAPFERFGSSYYAGSYGFYGDPRLKPERSVGFDAGIDQWLMHNKLRLSATEYYTDLRQTIIFSFSNFPQPDPFGRYGGYLNSNSGGIARGVEFSSQFLPVSKTSIQFNYTYTNADQRTPTIGTDYFEIPWTSRHQVSTVVTQWITPRLSVTMDWLWTSDYSYSPYGANGRRMVFSGPNKTDLVASYRIPIHDIRSIEVYGKVSNAFNVRYFEGGNTTPGIWGIGGLKFNF